MNMKATEYRKYKTRLSTSVSKGRQSCFDWDVNVDPVDSGSRQEAEELHTSNINEGQTVRVLMIIGLMNAK